MRTIVPSYPLRFRSFATASSRSFLRGDKCRREFSAGESSNSMRLIYWKTMIPAYLNQMRLEVGQRYDPEAQRDAYSLAAVVCVQLLEDVP